MDTDLPVGPMKDFWYWSYMCTTKTDENYIKLLPVSLEQQPKGKGEKKD